MKYNPNKNPLRLGLITTYLKNGLTEEALREIKKFALYQPDTVGLYLIWGNYYFVKGDIDKAIDNYGKVLAKDRNFFRAHYRLSQCYKREGDIDKSVDFALACFKLNPYFYPNLVQLGDL